MPLEALTRPERLHLADELRTLLHGVRLAVAQGDEETAHAAAQVGATDAALAAAIARSRAARDEARALLAEGECVLAALEDGTESWCLRVAAARETEWSPHHASTSEAAPPRRG